MIYLLNGRTGSPHHPAAARWLRGRLAAHARDHDRPAAAGHVDRAGAARRAGLGGAAAAGVGSHGALRQFPVVDCIK